MPKEKGGDVMQCVSSVELWTYESWRSSSLYVCDHTSVPFTMVFHECFEPVHAIMLCGKSCRSYEVHRPDTCECRDALSSQSRMLFR